ncbi:MAG: ABC transporter substrate-binding protein, partial [Variibacter sp.]
MTKITRRNFGLLAGGGAAALALGTRPAAAQGQVVVGTWGGDYQNLQQKHIVDPLMKPKNIEVIFATGNDTERKVKLMAEKRLPRGSMDIVCLTQS